MAVISGYVEHIIFRNQDNGYTVMELAVEKDTMTLVGTFSYISEGEYIEAEGELTEHPVYGEQLRVARYELKTPEDVDSIKRYLGSGAIKGVGPSLAARIVKKFKADTFRIMEEEPERLVEVKGISESKAIQIGEQAAEKRDQRQAMLFLQQYGITVNLAVKIYKRYGDEIYSVIKTNPYRMADDISGVGFKIADEIAARAGLHTDSDFRIKSGLMYVLQQALGNGHVYLPAEELKAQTSQLLQVELDSVERHIMDLTIDKKLVVKAVPEGQGIYISKYYYMELNTAKMLHDLNVRYPVPEEGLLKKLDRIESQTGMELEEQQRQAFMKAARNGLLVITGGPGTGKTTVIRNIIQFFESEDMEILLAAPTGRAAKRMTEATGCEARTIHRMLELNGVPEEESRAEQFQRNEQNPLEADAIIIEEMSMVDINLLYALLKAVTVGTRLILVGDVDQLPSVGPGNVLRDVIGSEAFAVVKLEKIFRQAAQSDIIVNAHKINAGEWIDPEARSKDFLFIKRQDANAIINASITLVRDKLPRYVGAPMYDIQVMTPMRKGALGVERLNTILQEFLNPPSPDKKEKELGAATFREGDKVMQIKNNYQMEWEVRSQRYDVALDKGTGVFNGDMGVVRRIDLFGEQLTVEYDENRFVTYEFKQLDELELAYAITIHKSQGSEYPAVVIPLLSGPRMLMNRNLIYTAVTRARSCVCIVGSPQTFQEMVANERQQRRYSSLSARIREL